jgi:sulfur carrier protein
MRIVVNGKDLTCADSLTVIDLLKQLDFSANAIVVERNAEILQRSHYETTELAEGDALELIRFVGGG